MRLLVTGWQGQLAQALIARSLRAGDVEACAVGRPALDLCSLPTIERAMTEVRPSVVVNTAAYTAVDAAESDEAAAHALNAKGAGMIAEVAARMRIPIIHISTDYVYDGTKTSPYVETDPTNPINAYGRSKLAGERAVARANPRHVILRTCWVYSATGKNFVKTMLRLAQERPELGVVDDQFGCPTYAPHLADAILAIVRALRSGDGERRWGIYHAAGDGDTSWYGLAQAIFEETGTRDGKQPLIKALATPQYPTPARRPANSRLDCSKLHDSFGVRQPHWRSGLSDCLHELGV